METDCSMKETIKSKPEKNTGETVHGNSLPCKTTTLIVSLGCLVVAVLWAFPYWHYRHTDPNRRPVWLVGQTNVPGWVFRALPVDESAERLLVADEILNGEFTEIGGRKRVRVFSAKRLKERPNEIGLFIHTPDRCWTMAGWQLEADQPEYRRLKVHGLDLLMERRIFRGGLRRELVYFGGLVGGEPLPYRLDQNLGVGKVWMKGGEVAKSGRGFWERALDKRLWSFVWASFKSGKPLLGPKQFIRISTTIEGADLDEADALLQEFLKQWLVVVPWTQANPSTRPKTG